MSKDFSLEVVSQHPEFAGKSFKKYNIGDEEVIGAWHDEPFEIVFKNNTYQKVQVKISIDGTDVLTGKLADTEINKDMWVVAANSSLRLKAWPETNAGGAQFVFTTAEKSVAVGTHGNLSSRGVIAAAVFTESYQNLAFYSSGMNYSSGGYTKSGSSMRRSMKSSDTTKGGTFNSTNFDLERSTGDFLRLSDSTSADAASASFGEELISKANLESLASVGAGQQVAQAITSATGLYQPKFNSIVKVKYSWWKDLSPKLDAGFAKVATATGFPGDIKPLMSLGTTPRLPDNSPPPEPVAYTRF